MIRPQLLLFLLRPMALLTGCAMGIMAPFVLLYRGPIEETNLYPFLFVVLHSIAIASWLHPARRHSRYCYGRGYTRNTLWRQQYLAAAITILAVWLPAALIIATPLRGVVQDRLYHSPYYPLMRPREAMVVFQWLLWYAVLFPPFHYACVRHPSASGANGYVVALAAVLTLFIFCLNQYTPGGQAHSLPQIGNTVSIFVALIAMVAGRRLHREMEVHV